MILIIDYSATTANIRLKDPKRERVKVVEGKEGKFNH